MATKTDNPNKRPRQSAATKEPAKIVDDNAAAGVDRSETKPEPGNPFDRPDYSAELSRGFSDPDRPLKIGVDNRIGEMADVFHESGYFPGLSPSQLATLIIAGAVLNLDAIAAVTDLEFREGRIKWKDDRSFETIQDQIEPERFRKEIDNNAAKVAGLGSVTPISDEDAADHAAAVIEAGNKVLNFANKGDLSVSAPNDANEPEKSDARPVNGEARAGLEETPGRNSTPAAEPELITPNPALPAADQERIIDGMNKALHAADPEGDIHVRNAAAAVGLSVPETINYWRIEIESMLKDMGKAGSAIDDRLAKFDAENTPAKRGFYEAIVKYYNDAVSAIRGPVMERLAADGKTTLEQCKGFFIFCEVPIDPKAWKWSDARKVEFELNAIEAREPKPAA